MSSKDTNPISNLVNLFLEIFTFKKEEEEEEEEKEKGDESQNTKVVEETKVASHTALVIFKVSDTLEVKEYAYKVFVSSGTDAYVNSYLTTIKLNNKDAPYIVSETLAGSEEEEASGIKSMITNFVTNVKSFVAPNYYYLVVFKKSDDDKWIIRDKTQPFIPILEETYESLIVNGLKKNGLTGGKKKSTVHKITKKRNQHKKVFSRKNIKRASSQKE